MNSGYFYLFILYASFFPLFSHVQFIKKRFLTLYFGICLWLSLRLSMRQVADDQVLSFFPSRLSLFEVAWVGPVLSEIGFRGHLERGVGVHDQGSLDTPQRLPTGKEEKKMDFSEEWRRR